MKPLSLAALVALSLAAGYLAGQQQEVRTHASYIQSLNLGGK